MAHPPIGFFFLSYLILPLLSPPFSQGRRRCQQKKQKQNPGADNRISCQTKARNGIPFRAFGLSVQLSLLQMEAANLFLKETDLLEELGADSGQDCG